MIFVEYDSLIKSREAAAVRIAAEIQDTDDPIAAMEKANAELSLFQMKINECENRLFSSPDTYDKVYRLRFIKGKRVEAIAQSLHMDQSSVYRILRKIKQKVAKK